MPFCKACGQEIGDAAFCPKCGTDQFATVGVGGRSNESPVEGIEENVAAALCYMPFFGLLIAIVFLLAEKRPFVRFHSGQSIALCAAAFAGWIVFWVMVFMVGIVLALIHFPVGILMVYLGPLLAAGFFFGLVVCMVRAYRHESFKIPVIGDMVEKALGPQT